MLPQLTAVWPAGYPICIAGVAKLTNASSLLASKIVNLLFLGFIFMLLYKWLGKYAWFTALYFLSFGKLEIFTFTWSEGPCLFFVVLVWFFLSEDFQTEKRDRFLFLKIFFSLTGLFLFRYAGLIYYFFVALFLAYYAYKKQWLKAAHYFIALIFSSLFALAYFYHNYTSTGYFTGGSRIFPEKESVFTFLSLLIKGLINETFLARNYFFTGKPDILFLVLAALQVLVLGIVLKFRPLIAGKFFKPKVKMLLLAGLFYLAALIILRIFSPFDAFDFRILAPFSTPICIAFFYSITQHQAFFRKTYKWIVFFMVISLLVNLPKAYILDWLKQLHF